jgi:adenosylcobinamide-phosphate guanylyltransferase
VDIVALVLAGGKGSRIKMGQEKPLVEVSGIPMIMHVISALRSARGLKRIMVAVSPNTPKTREEMIARSIEVIDTPGEGYIADTRYAIRQLGLDQVLTVPADLPSITPELVEYILGRYIASGKPALAAMALTRNSQKIGIDPEYRFQEDGREVSPIGVNILDGKSIHLPEIEQEILVIEDEDPPINVNTADELKLATEQLSRKMTARTKSLAHSLGADLVGIANSDALPPEKAFDDSIGGLSFVVTAYSFYSMYPADNFSWDHKKLKGWEDRGLKIVDYLSESGYTARLLSGARQPDFLGGISFCQLASMAGLGCIGRNHVLVTPEYGPRVFLSIIMTDAPLNPDPSFAGSFCEECRMCLDSCPSGALREDGVDYERCRTGRSSNCGSPCIFSCPVGKRS